MRRPVLLLVLVTFMLAGCTGGSGDPEPPATPDPQPAPTQQISLDDLGIAGWPTPAGAVPAPPRRPGGVSASEYDEMVTAVRTWALQAATDPGAVGNGLPTSLASAIEDAADAQTEPGLARATALDPALAPRDTRMTAVWQVSDADGAVNVSLQTRTAHEVTTEDGLVRVIGVLRTQGVVAGEGTDEWGTVTGWQEFGAADCAIVLDGFLTPGGDADDQVTDLTRFAEIGNGDEAITPALPEEEQVDEDFAEACEAGRV
ncbi:hypothetical protein H1W00_01365 [Aeromicrobium sp. Marseille-Q0843]|uniref:Lipoprotein n=1 Tax=Aeromicrobium phoceense TaxID=2754045 RepID=A0A838XB32_9ACTN|nr:hypothetical protein [Aeromicrobium phoceense]MBA4607122.1 hypothetical protein [Aeromicrobium phoceense]